MQTKEVQFYFLSAPNSPLMFNFFLLFFNVLEKTIFLIYEGTLNLNVSRNTFFLKKSSKKSWTQVYR